MPELAYLNSRFCAIEEAAVPVNDRGYQFGDGVYEVVRSYAGRLWALERHMQRLKRSLSEIGITGIETDVISKKVRKAFFKSWIQDAVVYIQITRGVQPRSHAWKDGLTPSLLITVRRIRELPAETYVSGVEVITADENRWKRRDIKSINLLPNCIALKEAENQEAYETVFIENGHVTEAASASLFIATGGTLVTRGPGPCTLPGVTQQLILECAQELGILTEERTFTPEEMFAADEAFLSSTTAGVIGIRAIDSKPAGSSCPGELTRRISTAYTERVENHRD